MHFSIPDTEEIQDHNNSSFTVFNIHINGAFHCAVRYSKFHAFNEQLKKEFGANCLPPFPPKKILSLTPVQLEERRAQLERYTQILSQDPQIANSDCFNGFLLSAQQESQKEVSEDVVLDVYLMNGHKIPVNIVSTEQADDVLETMASQIDLTDEFVYYFGLFLVRKDEGAENSIVRQFQEFESPYISLKAANRSATHRIVLRKCFWDPGYDEQLLDNRIALNLLYVQTVSDIERGWVLATKDQRKQLTALQQRGSKKEYMRLARTLKYYSFIQFKPCFTDYPQPDCRVIVSAGHRELNFRVQVAPDQVKEAIFKVTRMRCWRITTTVPEGNEEESSLKKASPELSFEYLVAKDTLKWITVTSEQAILMSMCLQGMVDEVIMEKQGRKIRRPQDRNRSTQKRSAAKRDTADSTTTVEPPPAQNDYVTSTVRVAENPVKKISEKLSQINVIGGSTRSAVTKQGLTENTAFEGIGDDDL